MSRDLSLAEIEALLDLVEPEETCGVDDAALLRLALGIADADTRLACARAMLGSPAVRERLARIRWRLAEELSEEVAEADIVAAVENAHRIARVLAEGRWEEGSSSVRTHLPEMRRAWRAAVRQGSFESVEALTRSLLVPLMEMGMRDEFDELAIAAHRAADAQGPKLRRLVLSYQGVAASKRGDSTAAEGFWLDRLRLAREVGNRPVEADTLLDLASQALADDDLDKGRQWLSQAEIALRDVDRTDMRASLETLRSVERRRAGDLGGAIERAERALDLLRGRVGVDLGTMVRMEAAKALSLCGRRREAIGLYVDALELGVEGGLGAHVADVLRHLGGEIEEDGQNVLALRCYEAAWAIDAALGTRRLGLSQETVSAARGRNPGVEAWAVAFEGWPEMAMEVVRTLRRDVSVSV